MGAMGFGVALVAWWLIDSALTGRGPLSSLRGILASKPGTVGADPSTYDSSIPLTGGVFTSANDSTVTAVPGSAQAAVAYALAQVGKPYKWGATGPDSFDCSGLIYMAYKAAGITIGRTTYQQILNGKSVSGPLLPGDLVFPDTGHVEIVVNSTQTVQAPHTGATVELSTIPSYIAARRIVSTTPTTLTSGELFLP